MKNKKAIQNNFSSKAAVYNDFAAVQKNAAKKLCNLAKPLIANDAKVLDLGAGTGFVAKNLVAENKNLQIFEIDFAADMLKHWLDRPSNIFPVLADIENLPFKKNESFDIIISSFALQWLDNFAELFANLNSILKKNGYIIFCLPLQETFAEIKNANKKSGCNFFLKSLADGKKLRQNLLEFGFKEYFFASEVVLQRYLNAVEALKEFKKIGVNYSPKDAPKNTQLPQKLPNKKSLQKFNDFFLQDSNNTTSWHLCYLIYQK